MGLLVVLQAPRHLTVALGRLVSQVDLTVEIQEQRSRLAQVEVLVLPVLLAAAGEQQKAHQVQQYRAALAMDMEQVGVGLAV